MQIHSQILKDLYIEPILLDVGASGEPPEQWQSIAKQSMYIGFDPDLREIQRNSNDKFKKSIIMNVAVTPEAEHERVKFYLTRSPFCSSTLLPNKDVLKNYAYADLFEVVDEVFVAAKTIDVVLQLHVR